MFYYDENILANVNDVVKITNINPNDNKIISEIRANVDLAHAFKCNKGGYIKQSGTHATTIFTMKSIVFQLKKCYLREPIKETNLSKSLAPKIETIIHTPTITNLNKFLRHLTLLLNFPLLINSPPSIIRTAGNNCNGIESRIAIEYKNCTACTNLSSCGKLLITTVCILDQNDA